MMRRAGWSGRSGKVAEMFGERGGVGRCWGGGGGDGKADLVPRWHGEAEGRVGGAGGGAGGHRLRHSRTAAGVGQKTKTIK